MIVQSLALALAPEGMPHHWQRQINIKAGKAAGPNHSTLDMHFNFLFCFPFSFPYPFSFHFHCHSLVSMSLFLYLSLSGLRQPAAKIASKFGPFGRGGKWQWQVAGPSYKA
jgi:hypothetical protein